jgi:hypothetical protein
MKKKMQHRRLKMLGEGELNLNRKAEGFISGENFSFCNVHVSWAELELEGSEARALLIKAATQNEPLRENKPPAKGSAAVKNEMQMAGFKE